MSILDNIFGTQDNNQNNNIVNELAGRFGLDRKQVQDVVDQLIPAVSAGIAHNTQQNNASSLLNLFQPATNIGYESRPELLQEPKAKEIGNNILGQIFGSKDISRQVAQSAEQKTGINSDIIKKMLPIVAILAISALRKRASESHTEQSSEGLMGQISNMFGGYQQNSIAGEVLNLLKQRK